MLSYSVTTKWEQHSLAHVLSPPILRIVPEISKGRIDNHARNTASLLPNEQ
jgi:hypothetical protein